MITSAITPKDSAIIDKWTDRALATYLFISRLPSPLAEFTFRQVVEDAYNYAMLLPRATRVEIVTEGICEALYYGNENFSALLECLDLSYIDGKDIDEVIAQCDRGLLLEKMKALYKLNDLPPKDGLVNAYASFTPDDFVEDDGIASLKGYLRDKLEQVYCEYDTSFLDEASSTSNFSPFMILGYKTFFINWSAGIQPSNRDKDKLFFQWYCKGELLSLVFDVIFRGPVTTVSRLMWKHLNGECGNNYHLKNIVQKQYDEYRVYNPALPAHDFTYKGQDEPSDEREKTRYFPALPGIIANENGSIMTETQLNSLYQTFKDNDYLDEREAPLDAFKRIFSGKGNFARPIKWNGQQRFLASFLTRARGRKTSLEYARAAANLFLQKNGKPCKVNTLNQPNEKADRKIESIFNIVLNPYENQ
jgi:hypothetical protein